MRMTIVGFKKTFVNLEIHTQLSTLKCQMSRAATI